VLPTEGLPEGRGLPSPTRRSFVEWVEDFFRGFSGEEGMERGDGQQPKMAAATASIIAYVDRGHRRPPRQTRATPRWTSSPTWCARRSTSGRSPTRSCRASVCSSSSRAWTTTRAHLGWLLYHLATHPEDRRRVATDEAIIPSAVEESLRYYR